MCAIDVFHGPGQTPDTIVGLRATGLIEAVDDFQGQPAKAEKEKPRLPLLGRAVEAEVDGVWLRHEADPADPRPEISGHFHPKLRLSLRGRHVSRRCFVGSATKLILPALGALTGGLDAGHGEIRRAVGPGAAALVPVADRLLRFPLS